MADNQSTPTGVTGTSQPRVMLDNNTFADLSISDISDAIHLHNRILARAASDAGREYNVNPLLLTNRDELEQFKETQEKPTSDATQKLTGQPLYIYMLAEKISEDREAAEIMGASAADATSQAFLQNFKRPGFINTTPLNSGNANLSGPHALYEKCAQYLGKKYVWGGKDLESAGVDCSGYVRGIFQKFGITLPYSSQDEANAIADLVSKQTGKPRDALITTCQNITADKIPDNAVMTMGPKNGIGHVVIVTTKPDGERVVMQSMGGGVGVCEMPLDKFVAYLHRQPAERGLTVANSGPLFDNKLATAPVVTSRINANQSQTFLKEQQRLQPARFAPNVAPAPAPLQTAIINPPTPTTTLTALTPTPVHHG